MMFEYKISFVDGSAWWVTTDEDPFEICSRSPIFPEILSVETLGMVSA